MKTRIALAGFEPAVAAGMADAGFAPAGHIYTGRPVAGSKSGTVAFEHFKLMRETAQPTARPSPAVPAPAPPHDILEMFIRCVDRWDWSRELVHSHACYHDLYSLAHARAASWLDETAPDLLVFSNVPHQGALIALHQAAMERKIACRICLQSPFGANHFSLPHWSHLGELDTRPGRLPGHPAPRIDVQPPTAPPFYMRSVRNRFQQKLRSAARQSWSAARYAAGTLVNYGQSRQADRRRLLNRMAREIDNAQYMKMAASVFSARAASLEARPYIYFPLHLQPEMTTDILGGEYADQLRAIEDLRQRIPPELLIAVKENPKQRGFMRSEAFFARMQDIPNLVLLDTSEPSFELASGSLAVATICGTAGWEALRMGKPAICFGHAFWNRMSGAFRIQDDWQWDEIAGFEFDSGALEADAARLSNTLMPGYSDPNYSAGDAAHDPALNTQILVAVIRHLAEQQG